MAKHRFRGTKYRQDIDTSVGSCLVLVEYYIKRNVNDALEEGWTRGVVFQKTSLSDLPRKRTEDWRARLKRCRMPWKRAAARPPLLYWEQTGRGKTLQGLRK